jgi:hypothetical protein
MPNGRHRTALQYTKFRFTPPRGKDVARLVRFFGPDRTKMFHVKHFGTIGAGRVGPAASLKSLGRQIDTALIEQHGSPIILRCGGGRCGTALIEIPAGHFRHASPFSGEMAKSLAIQAKRVIRPPASSPKLTPAFSESAMGIVCPKECA